MPSILSPTELEGFRSLIRDLVLPDEAIILRPTRVSNNMGSFTETWGTVDVGGTIYHPCRFTKSSPQELAIAGLTTEQSAYTVVFPAEWDVQLSDRIHLTAATLTVDVQGVLAPKTWELQRRVVCTYTDS